ncbi:MAG TPA: hypothetical protein VLF89_07290 [Candidatus Saccharimonadales bacterium]|nr:hypothetical protein [Candidatus Saccharimonadales bacterium]
MAKFCGKCGKKLSWGGYCPDHGSDTDAPPPPKDPQGSGDEDTDELSDEGAIRANKAYMVGGELWVHCPNCDSVTVCATWETEAQDCLKCGTVFYIPD